MLKKITLAVALAAFPLFAVADPLSAMQADAQALQQMAQTWPQIQSAAQSYGQLAPYAEAEWSGLGPVVTNSMGFREQCHNTRWDEVTQSLVTGALNIGGDGEAEAYSMQAVSIDFQEQLSNYIVQLVQSGNSQQQALANRLMAQKGPLLTSLNNLTSLLNTVSNQLVAATGPNNGLQQLPITNFALGIGNVPNLSQAQYIIGPSNGAPIGWYGIAPVSPLARLVDICPTGTGSLPMLNLAGPVAAAANQAIADEPALAQEVQPLESGSTWTVPGAMLGMGPPSFQTRSQLVSALATDEQAISRYMAPVNQPLAQFEQSVQQIMQEVQAQ